MIYVINLKRDSDKKKYIENELNDKGLSYEIIEGVDGSKLSQNELDKIYDKEKSIKELGRELSVGEIGCSLSHLKIANYIVANHLDFAIILEDDAKIIKNPSFIIKELKSLEFCDFDVIHLGCQSYDGWFYSKFMKSRYKRFNQIPFGNTALVKVVGDCFGTYGYILSNVGARKLINYNSFIVRPIDAYTQNEYMNCYMIKDHVIGLKDNAIEESTIGYNRNKVDKKINKKEIFSRFIYRLKIEFHTFL